jgi:hypothetical protein
MTHGPQLRCVCSQCVRARYLREVRAAAGVIGWTIIILAALIGGCLLIVGCTTTPVVTECEHGLSWRVDCNQPLFKE